MPLRITPDKLLLIYYDADTDSWVTREGLSVSLLSQFVEVQPGVTVENVFQLVDTDPRVKTLLSEYCSCDIDAIRKLPPLRAGRPVEVPTAVEWKENGPARKFDTVEIDTVVVTPSFWVATDERSGQRLLEGSYMLGGRSSADELSVVTFGGENRINYADIKDLFFRLDPTLNIEDYDTAPPAKHDTEQPGFTATMRYTLLDALSALVRHFGTEPFDSRYQPDIDYERALEDRVERDSAETDDEID